jgi:hypothetical protein
MENEKKFLNPDNSCIINPEFGEKIENLKKELIERAREIYGKIDFPGNKESFDDCFTVVEGVLYFWFNDENDGTHVVKEKLPN